mgnify:CR=1 FL=1
MAAAKYDLTIEQGATFTLNLVWKSAGGTPNDLTGYSARMQIRASASSPTTIANLVSPTDIVLGGALGTIVITISAAQTAEMTRGGVYDFELVNGSVVTRLIYGSVSLSKEVTR